MRPTPVLTGFVDFNGYYDVRDFSVVTLNILLNLPHGFQYFSLVNYQNALDRKSLQDLETFYTEQHLNWAPVESLPLELTALWTIASGPGNDSLRFGILWRVSKTPFLERLFRMIHLSYFVNFHAVQIDELSGGYRSQIEHVYRLDLLPSVLGGRVYLGGFTDHNLWFGAPAGTATSSVVSELQFGVRIVGGLHAVAEVRYNEYLAARKTGLGLGLQYFVPITLQGTR